MVVVVVVVVIIVVVVTLQLLVQQELCGSLPGHTCVEQVVRNIFDPASLRKLAGSEVVEPLVSCLSLVEPF